MIEPRCSLLHVHRRNLSKAGGTNEVFHAVFAADVEPERPIHPALEYEVLFYEEDDDEGEEEDNHDVGIIPPYAKIDDKIDTAESSLPASQDQKTSTSRRIKLLLSFVLLLFSGTGTVVSMKLQAVPMYNYPNFLNLLCHFCYIPLCFLYIVPMIRYGSSITPEQIASSRKPFMIMGALDCLASTLQIFASIYVPGNLLVLLPQAVIPCSMALSHLLLGERYHRRQYIGALVVLLGLLVVLEPVFTFEHSPDFYCEAIDTDSDCTLCRTENTQRSCMSHFQPSGDDDLGEHSPVQNICQWLSYQQATKKEEELTLGWSLLLLASAIPMTLSAMYKQAALDVAEMDPVYLNGWIAIFQFLFALLVAVPAAWMTRVTPLEVPRNMWDGLLCFLGQGMCVMCALEMGHANIEANISSPVLLHLLVGRIT